MELTALAIPLAAAALGSVEHAQGGSGQQSLASGAGKGQALMLQKKTPREGGVEEPLDIFTRGGRGAIRTRAGSKCAI